MERLKKAALLTTLAQKLREKSSWCGETHIQKATYFLQELLKVPMEFEFILYKHGPYSFDLHEELSALIVDELFDLQPQPTPYGPKLVPTKLSARLKENYSRTIEEYHNQIEFIASTLGNMRVAKLESLATSFYVTQKESPGASIEKRAKLVLDLKSHLALSEIKESVQELDEIIRQAQELVKK
jgi:uncharacterized protein YwgA